MTISQHEPRFIIPGWAFGPESLGPLAEKLGGEILALPSLASRGAGHGHDRGVSPWARGLLAAIPASAPCVTLIGWSLGAMIALESAMANPDRDWRLVLLAGSARFVADAGNDPGVPERNLRAMMAGLRRSREATIQRFRQECCRPAVMNDACTRARIDLDSNGWSDGELRAGLEYLISADLRPGLSAMPGSAGIDEFQGGPAPGLSARARISARRPHGAGARGQDIRCQHVRPGRAGPGAGCTRV